MDKSSKKRRPVYKISSNMDKSEILCTTHQMDNFYVQFAMGQIKESGVMNYVQHLVTALIPDESTIILDVCCGRSMILPLLKYHGNKIKKYIGLDISAENLKEAHAYGDCDFECEWIHANAVNLDELFKDGEIDFIIFTSSLEHMHPEDGAKSLRECFKVLKRNGLMVLSTPNTYNGGYNTRYRAHIYEWNYEELKKYLSQIGFKIQHAFGILAGQEKDFEKELLEKYGQGALEYYQDIKSYVPSLFLTSFIAVPFPRISKEIFFLLSK